MKVLVDPFRLPPSSPWIGRCLCCSTRSCALVLEIEEGDRFAYNVVGIDGSGYWSVRCPGCKMQISLPKRPEDLPLTKQVPVADG